MFKIGDFSRLCRVPTTLIRYYAQIGLFEPAHTDKFTGYRYYSLDQLPRLNRILALKDLGLSLEQIKQVMEEDLSPDELRGMLRLKQAEIQQAIDEEQARLARVATRLRQIEQEGKMPEKEVVVKAIEPQHALTIRQVIPNPSDVGTLLGESFQALSMRGIQPVAPPFTLFHDDEFKPADMDVEIVLPVDKSVNGDIALGGERKLAAKTLPAIKTAACIIHTGEYDTFSETYGVIGRWIETNGYRITGPSREVYLAAPDSETGPITEIQFPVEKA